MGSVGQSDNPGVTPKSRYIYHLYVLAVFMLLMLNLCDLHVMLYSPFSQNFCDSLNNIEWAKITANAVSVHTVTNFLCCCKEADRHVNNVMKWKHAEKQHLSGEN